MLIHWLMARGLIAEGDVCSMCGVEMVLTITSCLDRSDGSKLECKRQDKGKRHKTEISIRKSSKKAKRYHVEGQLVFGGHDRGREQKMFSSRGGEKGRGNAAAHYSE